jgi:hypothetical protein
MHVMMRKTVRTLNDLRAAFDGTYPTKLSEELYDRAKAEGYEMAGYVRSWQRTDYSSGYFSGGCASHAPYQPFIGGSV